MRWRSEWRENELLLTQRVTSQKKSKEGKGTFESNDLYRNFIGFKSYRKFHRIEAFQIL